MAWELLQIRKSMWHVPLWCAGRVTYVVVVSWGSKFMTDVDRVGN